jgi:N-acetyl-anhydromuramoyl-L-alanine amidase
MPAGQAVTIDVGRGLVEGARFVPSPNQDARPPGASIDLVVVHGIGLPPGEFGGPWVEQLFLNRLPSGVHPFFETIADLKVSAHLFIRRDGSTVQFVPFHARAWHAGPSAWRHRVACNDYSVGIELEGADEVPYEPVQYEVLAATVAALAGAYGTLAPDAVAGHSDVAPGRKTDPGPAFDWAHFRRRLTAARAP